ILSIRKSAIAKDGPHATWVYRPIQHKSSHKGKKRFLVFGSEGQALIEAQSSLHPDSDWLFPSKRFNSHYKPEGYCHAVTQAAKLAGVPHWTPYQLRHIAATGIAVEKGLEAAAAVLGHVSMQTTGTYQHQPDAKQIRDATGHTEPKPNLVAELERLAALKERGLLTAEEFTLAKGKLLC
ncbi:MAG TPA: tyrosine-type recombinase/integrase, partial [Gemmatales bacterium]|nr:tyrosine-type recombinase/integrase [Gemmatales bacterium]